MVAADAATPIGGTPDSANVPTAGGTGTGRRLTSGGGAAAGSGSASNAGWACASWWFQQDMICIAAVQSYVSIAVSGGGGGKILL